MNIEERLNNLDERLAKIEKIEKRRKIARTISYIFKSIYIVILIVLGIEVYSLYKEFKDELKYLDEIKEEINDVEDFLNGKIDGFQGLFN